MQMRRRFQPMVVGLPYRIAPSSVAVAPAVVVAPLGAGGVMVTPCDADPPQNGTGSTILLAPPPTSGNGTLTC